MPGERRAGRTPTVRVGCARARARRATRRPAGRCPRRPGRHRRRRRAAPAAPRRGRPARLPATRFVAPAAGTQPGVRADGSAVCPPLIARAGSRRTASEAGYHAAATAMTTPAAAARNAARLAAASSCAEPAGIASMRSANAATAPNERSRDTAEQRRRKDHASDVSGSGARGSEQPELPDPSADADEERGCDEQDGKEHGERGTDPVDHEAGEVDLVRRPTAVQRAGDPEDGARRERPGQQHRRHRHHRRGHRHQHRHEHGPQREQADVATAEPQRDAPRRDGGTEIEGRHRDTASRPSGPLDGPVSSTMPPIAQEDRAVRPGGEASIVRDQQPSARRRRHGRAGVA